MHVYLETAPGSKRFNYRGEVDAAAAPSFAHAMSRSRLVVMGAAEKPDVGERGVAATTLQTSGAKKITPLTEEE